MFALALAFALGLACPHDPSLGSVSFTRAGVRHELRLGDCVDHSLGKAPPAPRAAGFARVRVIRTSGGAFGTQTIVAGGRPVLTVPEDFRDAPAGSPGPIVLRGTSPDRRWVFFAIDPLGSASLAADGLMLEAVRVADGRRVKLGRMLLSDEYMTWCGSRLVLVLGGGRVATWNKRLAVAAAPDWRPRPLWPAPGRAFGSLSCAPDGRSVAVLSQPASTDAELFHARWQLWQVGLDGSPRLLDRPPAGSADESPRWGRRGSLFFVRERRGRGTLWLLRTGPIASLGNSLGYYGRHDWPYSIR